MIVQNYILKTTFIFSFLVLIFSNFSSNLYAQNSEESYFQQANKLFKKELWQEAKQVIDIGLKDTPFDADLLMLNGKY